MAAQERESIDEMKRRGLNVVEIDDAGKAAFRAVAAEMTASWRGDLIPADVYDMAVEARDAFRPAAERGIVDDCTPAPPALRGSTRFVHGRVMVVGAPTIPQTAEPHD